eukprot:TRINITY_DN27600_c0_g1_i1.p2 TRINITY_DN27600_c0_g1~~TRINITY_DN27600_c0_g1_i1.p2  ORF type:complete len:230 (+),score=54.53 TRINITY_DN27600_c0_g1_i1:95-784(+)
MAPSVPMPPRAALQLLHDEGALDRPLAEYPEILVVSGGTDEGDGLDNSLLNGEWYRTDETMWGAPVYRHAQHTHRELRRWRMGGVVWCFPTVRRSGCHVVRDCGTPAAALPQQVRRWVCPSIGPVSRELGPAFRVLARRGLVLCVGGTEISDESLNLPLSEVGVSAECVLELVSVPDLAEDTEPAEEGTLCVFISAPSLGHQDILPFEVAPGTTVGQLLAAFLRRCSSR